MSSSNEEQQKLVDRVVELVTGEVLADMAKVLMPDGVPVATNWPPPAGNRNLFSDCKV